MFPCGLTSSADSVENRKCVRRELESAFWPLFFRQFWPLLLFLDMSRLGLLGLQSGLWGDGVPFIASLTNLLSLILNYASLLLLGTRVSEVNRERQLCSFMLIIDHYLHFRAHVR